MAQVSVGHERAQEPTPTPRVVSHRVRTCVSGCYWGGFVITPQQVEARLVALSKELDAAQESLNTAELNYYQTKAKLEVQLAQVRLDIANGEKRVTVGEREDLATRICADLLHEHYTAEAVVRSMRANVNRIRTQVDIARSIGTSVRTSIDIS